MKKQKPDPLDRAALMHSAVDLLSRRDYSRQELWRKLSPKAASADDLESVLNNLAERNWQSDERFAAMYLRARSNRGVGPLRLKQELKQKGVSGDLTSEAMEQSDANWTQNAIEVAQKKARSVGFDHPQLKPKLWRFLAYRGFAGDVIELAIEKVMTERA